MSYGTPFGVPSSVRRPMKRTASLIAVAAVAATLTSCTSSADTASKNLSKAADHFEIQRRIVFYNGITGKYLLEIDGRCALGNNDGDTKVTVTCKTAPGKYVKHTLGLSDNVTYFSQQTSAANASEYHNRIVFRPEEILPDLDVQTSGDGGKP
jgi:hypothetical protein